MTVTVVTGYLGSATRAERGVTLTSCSIHGSTARFVLGFLVVYFVQAESSVLCVLCVDLFSAIGGPRSGHGHGHGVFILATHPEGECWSGTPLWYPHIRRLGPGQKAFNQLRPGGRSPPVSYPVHVVFCLFLCVCVCVALSVIL